MRRNSWGQTQHRKLEKDVKYSIVVPFYNEEANIRPLYEGIVAAMDGVNGRYEMIFVDDGSQDGTHVVLEDICDRDLRVSVIRLRRNFGQTTALQAGFDFAQGEIIISLDGDLQHDPAEIPLFIAKMEEGFDLVSGWRVQREDNWLTRKLPSRIANRIMAKFSRVEIHDFGTTFKAYRRELIHRIRLYGEHHRFIPALANGSGAAIAEIPIKNIRRKNGKSNYGLSRTTRVLLDLVGIKFLVDYATKPLQFFGFLGLLGTGAGALLSAFLLIKKFVFHQSILLEHGPILFMATVLILSGLQFLSIGLLGEMITRTYYEAQYKATYAVREINSRKARLRRARGSELEVVSNRGGSSAEETRRGVCELRREPLTEEGSASISPAAEGPAGRPQRQQLEDRSHTHGPGNRSPSPSASQRPLNGKSTHSG